MKEIQEKILKILEESNLSVVEAKQILTLVSLSLDSNSIVKIKK